MTDPHHPKTKLSAAFTHLIGGCLTALASLTLSALIASGALWVFEHTPLAKILAKLKISLDSGSTAGDFLRFFSLFNGIILISWLSARFYKAERLLWQSKQEDGQAFSVKHTLLDILQNAGYWSGALPMGVLLFSKFYVSGERLLFGHSLSGGVKIAFRFFALLIPFLLIRMGAWLTARMVWSKHPIEAKEAEQAPFQNPLRLAGKILLWSVSIFALLFLIFILYYSGLPAVFALFLPYLPAAAAIIAGILWMRYFVRRLTALRKRKAMIADLTAVCAEKGYVLTLNHPYRSLFWRRDEVNLSVQAADKTINGKLLFAPGACGRLVIANDGYYHTIRPFGIGAVTFFQVDSKHPLTLDFSGDQRVIILCTVKKEVFHQEGNRMTETANGDVCGDCTIFFDSAFVHSIERME